MFEKLNNISVSVYGWKETEKDGFAYPLKLSKDLMKKHVQLLLLENNDSYHYCWIKKFLD